MKRAYLIFLFVCVALPPVVAQSYGEFCRQLTFHQKKVKLKKYEKQEIKRRVLDIDTATFNLKHYLSIFSEVSVKPSCMLGYVYAFDDSGGFPVLYGKSVYFDLDSLVAESRREFDSAHEATRNRKISEAKSENLSPWDERKKVDRINIFYTSSALENREFLTGYARDSVNDAIRYLVPRDSKMGYFQFLMFQLSGENFALYWHAFDRYYFVIHDRKQIEELIQANVKEDFTVCFEENEMQPLLKKKLSPRVKLKKGTCLISIYEFYVREGIYKSAYSVQRGHPYRIKKEASEKLLSNKMRGIF